MKTQLKLLGILLLLSLTAHGTSELLPHDEILEPYAGVLNRQQALLENVRPSAVTPVCQRRYTKLWNDRTLHVDWFYGYLEGPEDDVVADRLVRNQTIRKLIEPCTRRFQGACGFRIVDGQMGQDPVILQKKLSGRRQVHLRMWQSAVEDWNAKNVIGIAPFFVATPAQTKKSAATAAAFLKSLTETEVVIYDGHARYGTGPGFYPNGILQYVGRALTRFDWTTMTYEMTSRGRHPDVLMIAACQSQAYYLPTLRQDFPRMAVAATQFEQTYGTNQQMGFALIDSLIHRRCGESLSQALTSADGRDDGAMKMFGF